MKIIEISMDDLVKELTENYGLENTFDRDLLVCFHSCCKYNLRTCTQRLRCMFAGHERQKTEYIDNNVDYVPIFYLLESLIEFFY